jgi:AmmeMemoRadiSam system protein A
LGVEVITAREQQSLLALARRTLEARVRGVDMPASERDTVVELMAGAFVTIHRRGNLRGCLGRVECDWPLTKVVVHLAAIVADSDPRFEPVTADELPEIDIEISLLTPERPIASIEEITIGRHGVIVEHGRRRGLLLPQVASERGWDARTFVEHTCQKAGLAADAWQNGARLSVFEALVFGEQPV